MSVIVLNRCGRIQDILAAHVPVYENTDFFSTILCVFTVNCTTCHHGSKVKLMIQVDQFETDLACYGVDADIMREIILFMDISSI
ncbi:MAG: hypothetical protein B1H11_13460 [Desulfobacteraceae bacterium 4484_190.1]|nr:MAG: hypothetical protein B1H11_13460 [Desulfobacteraceae bacterium 4484_190.1]